MANLDTKRNGRFIKKDDPLHKILSISDFSLSAICETPITFHDNAMANIIHEKLHLAEDLAETVRNSHEIEHVFPVQEERMIIRPIDFTDEWHRLRKRQSNRNQRNDDDDDFDLEAAKAEELEQDKADLEALEERMGNKKPAAEPEISASEPETVPVEWKEPQPAPLAPAIPERHAEPIMAIADEFIPYASNGHHQQQVATPEKGLNEEELEQLRQEAREEGFRQGFQSGEERATLESRSKIQAILEEVANIVGNLEGMQKSILHQVQENFYSICKTFIESMLHKEFALSPEVFGTVMERAINDALQDDEFKIFVSPKVAKELKNWSNEQLRSKLRGDDSLKDYNFRVEGQHASIDANLSKIITDLLDQADMQLFESNNKAG